MPNKNLAVNFFCFKFQNAIEWNTIELNATGLGSNNNSECIENAFFFHFPRYLFTNNIQRCHAQWKSVIHQISFPSLSTFYHMWWRFRHKSTTVIDYEEKILWNFLMNFLFNFFFNFNQIQLTEKLKKYLQPCFPLLINIPG